MTSWRGKIEISFLPIMIATMKSRLTSKILLYAIIQWKFGTNVIMELGISLDTRMVRYQIEKID